MRAYNKDMKKTAEFCGKTAIPQKAIHSFHGLCCGHKIGCAYMAYEFDDNNRQKSFY